jgi:hypothetical protein
LIKGEFSVQLNTFVFRMHFVCQFLSVQSNVDPFFRYFVVESKEAVDSFLYADL